MAEKNKTGIPEAIAIAAIMFFIWRMTHKKKVLNIEDKAPVIINPDQELAGKPGWNLNEYCQNIVYRPLASTDLVIDSLLGQGWCSRGDRSIVDKTKGYGDDYADKQAAEYKKRKSEEAEYINSKSVIQFRLINSTSAQITTSILNTTKDPEVFNAVTLPPPTPPPPPLSTYDDFFLPSQDEAVSMRTNLYLAGVGAFTAGIYHTSTETGGNGSMSFDFTSGAGVYTPKGTTRRVRACRRFIVVTGTYAMRDTGPAGGLIFIVTGNGNGTDTCFEAAPADQSPAQVWSNITSTFIGTTGSTIGSGPANTADIIAQAGHTDSAAKLCDDLIIIN